MWVFWWVWFWFDSGVEKYCVVVWCELLCIFFLVSEIFVCIVFLLCKFFEFFLVIWCNVVCRNYVMCGFGGRDVLCCDV